MTPLEIKIRAAAIYLEGKPPFDTAEVKLNAGEIELIQKALHLMGAVRIAVKSS